MAQTRVAAVIIDAHNPESLAQFWCELLDIRVAHRLGDPAHYVDCTPFAGEAYLGFQRVTDDRPAKNQLHLDLEPDDIEAVTAWVVGNGGRCALGRDVDKHGDVDEHGERWRVMLDPEGNEFCLWHPDQKSLEESE
jgi:predicted enzyme related to lactoylglutathione lyase